MEDEFRAGVKPNFYGGASYSNLAQTGAKDGFGYGLKKGGRAGYFFGGRAGYMGGGIADLRQAAAFGGMMGDDGRRAYGLGSFFKKAFKGIKKVFKSHQ